MNVSIQNYPIFCGCDILNPVQTLTLIISIINFIINYFSFSKCVPMWFHHDNIPYDQMWVDDKLWYPLLLQGKRFNAFFKFQGLHKVIDYNIH